MGSNHSLRISPEFKELLSNEKNQATRKYLEELISIEQNRIFIVTGNNEFQQAQDKILSNRNSD